MTEPFKDLSFNALFNVSPEPILLMNDSGHILMANLATQQLLGYTEEDISGIEFESLIPADFHDRTLWQPNFSHPEHQQFLVDNKQPITIFSHTGVELKLHVLLSDIYSEDRHYVLAFLRVAERRHQAEKQLEIIDERLSLAKQAASLGVFDFDANQNILHWDDCISELWGAETLKQMSQKRFTTVIHPEDRLARQEALDRAIDPINYGEYIAEYRVTNPINSVVRWVSAVGHMHFKNGLAVRLIGVARDITAQKTYDRKNNEERTESETFFTQQAVIQTVLAIAHELNQPLAAISAYSEVALKALEDGVTNRDSLKRALTGLVEQSQRAGRGLHELLAFLQKGNLLKENVDIASTIKEAVRITENDCPEIFNAKLYLETNIPPVSANRIQILKVLTNLLKNAGEAMLDIKRLESIIDIEVYCNQELNMVHISVRDSGPGVNHDIAQHIFDPFFTTKPKGLGMGLAICRSIIEANGGELWLEKNTPSKTNAGATFHLTLPLAA